MFYRAMFGAALALGVSLAAHAQPAPGGGDPTRGFITQAAQTDEFERREGRLAERRSHDPHITQFAAEMVAAHTKTTQGLKAAIRRAGMTPPPPPALSPEQARNFAQLSALHGPAFDRAYIAQQVTAHQQALGVVQGYAQNGHPGPIRDAAQSTVPIVQHHLQMATEIQSHLGG